MCGITAYTCTCGELTEKASLGGESTCDFCSPPALGQPTESVSSDLLRRSGHLCCVERWIEVRVWGLPGAGGILAASFPSPSCSIHANGNEASPELVGS